MNTISPRFLTRCFTTLCLTLFSAMSISTASAAVFRPTGLSPGDEYQLAFVTSGTIDATSNDIAVYNDFVNAQAALNPALTGTDTGVSWSAIVSTHEDDATPTVHARDNALVSAPIYLLDSSLVATGFADLWDGEIDHAISLNQFGNPVFDSVWTGTSTDGFGGGELGSSLAGAATLGDSSATFSEWIGFDDFSLSSPFPTYALSDPLTVPTPRAKIELNIIFTDPPTIADGQFPFGFSEENPFPDEIPVSFLLGEGTPAGGGATRYGIADVISPEVTFGDAVFTELQDFDVEVRSDGTFETLFWRFEPITTPTTLGWIMMNSPLRVIGTDIATGEAYEYQYATSAETITLIPEPSTLALCLGLVGVGVFRGTRRRGWPRHFSVFSSSHRVDLVRKRVWVAQQQEVQRG